jgi:hypothetical protein
VPGKSITIFEAPMWVQHLTEELHEAAIRGMQSAGLRLLQHIQVTVIPSTRDERTGMGPPVDRGAYRASWRKRDVSNGSVVESTLPYASIIELGARPENVKIGKAMIDALTDWVIRKGLAGKRPGNDSSGEYRSQARNIAWAIAVSMKKAGIFSGGKGLRVLERAAVEAPRFIKEEVTREIERVK